MKVTEIVVLIILSFSLAGCVRMGDREPVVSPGADQAQAGPEDKTTSQGQAETSSPGLSTFDGATAKTMVIGNVLFDFDKVVPKSSAKRELNQLVEFLKDHPTRKVVLEGHSDGTGAADYNRQLSIERANTIKHYLIKEGIKPELISVQGFGATRPVADNTTERGRSMNRRVEIKVR